jgi:hypothetical protein
MPVSQPKQFDKKDGDPLAWVISKNLQRRHLDETQRAYVATKVETLKQGQRADLATGKTGKFATLVVDRKAAAILMNVSVRLIAQAAYVAKHGGDRKSDQDANLHLEGKARQGRPLKN